MNIRQIEKVLIDAGVEINEAKVEAKILVKHFLGLSNVDLALIEDFEGKYSERKDLLDKLTSALNLRAKKRIPVQHIIGTAYFMGEDFIVNEHVLIPRDETEILVRKAVEIIKQKDYKHILDIGTGSGCIACMIAKLTEAQVVGVDISLDALQVALDNSSKLGLFNKAIFRKSDIFSNIRKEGHGSEKYDMIVSNPPYIPISEKDALQLEVKFEPESALFAHDIDGIDFYDKIIKNSPDFLNDGGYLMFELGINQAEKVKSLLMKNNFKNIEVERDLVGIERVIWGQL